MMWIGIQECIKIGLQVLKMFAFFHAFFVYSPKKEWKYVIAPLTCMIGVTFLLYFLFRPSDWLYWRVFSVFFVSYFLFQGRAIERIGISFFLYVFTDTLDAIWLLGYYGKNGTMKWILYGNQLGQMIFCTIMDLCLACIIERVIRKRKSKMVTGSQIALLCLVSICDVSALTCTQILLDGTYSTKVNNIVGGSMIVVCLLLGFFSIFQILVKNENIYYQKLLEEEKKYSEMQDKYYRELYAKNKQESKLRHDWKNHIACVNALCDRGDFDEVKNYIKKLEHNIQELGGNIDCGNPIVSVLVSQISKEAQENQINFQVHGHIVEELRMDSMDLCTLVSNLLKNALEACILTEKDRWMQLDLQYSKERLHICIRNTMMKNEIPPNQKMNSEKRDVKNHGYGMQNMQDVVEKYHGMIHWEGKNHIFSLHIMIPDV